MFIFFLIHSSFFNKLPQTGLSINNRNIFFTVLKSGSLRSGCPQGCQPSSWLQTSWVISWQTRQGSLLVLSYKGINPIHEGSALMTLSLPKALRSDTIPLSIRISIYEFWEGINIETVAFVICIFSYEFLVGVLYSVVCLFFINLKEFFIID